MSIGRLWPRPGNAEEAVEGRTRRPFLFRLERGAGFLNYLNRAAGECQLADVYPLLPDDCRPIGSLLTEPLIATLTAVQCALSPSTGRHKRGPAGGKLGGNTSG